MHTLLKYNVCSMGLALLVIPLFDFGASIRNESDVKRPFFKLKNCKVKQIGIKTENASVYYYQNESESGPGLYPVRVFLEIITEETGYARPLPLFPAKIT